MSFIDLDFTGVETSVKMRAGKQKVTVSAAELKKASTGSSMLAVTFKNAEGEVAFENFPLLPTTMWKLKMFLEAVYNTPITAQFRLNPDALVNKSLFITTEDEQYINSSGNPAVRARVLTDYAPLSVTETLGVAPSPVMPTSPAPSAMSTPVMPTAPTMPTEATPQPEVKPVAPTARPKLPWE